MDTDCWQVNVSSEVDILREEKLRLFDKWRKQRQRAWAGRREKWHLEGKQDFSDAWAAHARIEELERQRMGAELNKLQQRIGRQRKANRRLIERVKELEYILEGLSK
jgi:hypothetical protein